LEGQLERISRDLRHDGLNPLPDRRRPDIDRDRAAGFDHHAGVLFRAGAAAFDETGDADPMIAAVDQLAGERELLRPARLRNAALERARIAATVAGGLARPGLL